MAEHKEVGMWGGGGCKEVGWQSTRGWGWGVDVRKWDGRAKGVGGCKEVGWQSKGGGGV